MPVPNPIWGFHVAPGAVTAACLRRDAPDTWTLIEEATLRPAGEGGAAVEASVTFAQQRSIDTRPLFLALPDHAGTVAIAVLTPDDLGLDPGELKLALYAHTPFVPGEAELWHAPIEDGGLGRTHMVIAVPRSESRPSHAAIAFLDPATHGLGTSSIALLRGARALGLIEHHQILVEVLPNRTLLHAVFGRHLRRYVLRPGLDDLVAAAGLDPATVDAALVGDTPLPDAHVDALAAAAAPFAADVRRVIDYHHEHLLRRIPGDAGTPPHATALLVGPIGGSAALSPALRRALGDAAREPSAPQGDFVIRTAAGTPLGAATAARLCGAIGAALQGFGVPDTGLALRSLPSDVPDPPRRKAPVPALVGGLVVAGAAVAFVFAQRDGEDPVNPDLDDTATTAETHVTPETVTTPRAAGPLRLRKLARSRIALLDALSTVARLLDAGTPKLSCTRLEIADRAVTFEAHAAGTVDVARLVAALGAGPGSPADLEIEAVDGGVRVAFTVPPRELATPATLVEPLADVLGAGPDGGASATVGVLDEIARLAEGPMRKWTEDGTRRTLSMPVPRAGLGALLRALAHGRAPVNVERLDVRVTERETLDAVLELSVANGGAPSGGGRPLEPGVEAALAGALAGEVAEPRFAAPVAGRTTIPGLRLRVAAGGPGQVTLSWPKGPVGRAVERSADGGATWTRVTELGSEAGGTLDHVPGARGTYEWRIGLPAARENAWGAAHELTVDVPVTVELVDAGEDGTVVLELTRPWKGGNAKLRTSVRTGDAVRAERAREDAPPLVFDARATITAVRRVTRDEDVKVRVPVFAPDGKVERDAAGVPRSEERVMSLPTVYLEVEADGPDGQRLAWARKMTSP